MSLSTMLLMVESSSEPSIAEIIDGATDGTETLCLLALVPASSVWLDAARLVLCHSPHPPPQLRSGPQQ